MFRHIVLYRLKDRCPEAKTALKNKFLALQENVPQVEQLEVGIDVLHGERSYDVALVITLKNRSALAEYKSHPFHVEVAGYVHSVIEHSVCCDFEVEE